MRAGFALAVVGSLFVALLGAAPASAAPPAPVASVAVAVHADRPPHPAGSYFAPLIVVSWTGEDAAASGVVVCTQVGTTPSSDPTSCAQRRDVPAPGARTDQIKLRAQNSYAIAVFAYTEGQPREYSSPVTTIWHGSTLHGQGPYTLRYGDTVRLAAKLTDVHTKTALSAQTVQLLYMANGSEVLHSMGTNTTDAHGNVVRSLRARASGQYFWVYNGGNGHLSTSMQMSLYVAYRVTGHLTSEHAAPGQEVRLYGAIKPSRTDISKTVELLEYQTSGPCKGFYQVQQEHAAAKRQTLPNGQTTYGFVITVSRTAVGTHKFQAFAEGDKQLNGGTSPSVSLTVDGAAPAFVARC